MQPDGTAESAVRRYRRPARIPPVSWLVPAFASAAAAVFALWPVDAIRFESKGTVVKTVTVADGAELYLDYQHSVARVPVREVFIIPAPGSFLLIRTEHSAFGAGLPTESFGEFQQRNGVYINSGISRILPDIPLRVSAGAEQKLLVQGGPEIVLLDFFEVNSLVTITSRALPRLRAILG